MDPIPNLVVTLPPPARGLHAARIISSAGSLSKPQNSRMPKGSNIQAPENHTKFKRRVYYRKSRAVTLANQVDIRPAPDLSTALSEPRSGMHKKVPGINEPSKSDISPIVAVSSDNNDTSKLNESEITSSSNNNAADDHKRKRQWQHRHNITANRNRRQMKFRCPNAPHNTTSFLMNYHRREVFGGDGRRGRRDNAPPAIFDDNDSIGRGLVAYGSFFGRSGGSGRTGKGSGRGRMEYDACSLHSYSSR